MSRILLAISLLLSCASHPRPVDPVGDAKPPSITSIPVESFDARSLARAAVEADEQALHQSVIWFHIDSFGGSVFDGLSFIKYIEQLKRRTGVITVCAVDSNAMSMGFVFLESGACDIRLATKRSILLAHNCSSRAGGTARDLEKAAEFMKAIDKGVGEMVAARLHMTYDEYAKKIDGKDWVFNWDVALQVRAIDAVVTPEDIPPLPAPAT